ncbi:MAG: outer membrane beta-barrel protein [Chitinophagaceae bacterium]|jgi:hypothetical protein
MLHLLRKQIIIGLTFCISTGTVLAQREQNRPDHDDWPYYFGMTLGYNSSYLHASKHPSFMASDSVSRVEPGASGGIALGLLATLRINHRFELRANPQLILGGSRSFTYTLPKPALGEQPLVTKVLPSTIVSFPVHFKFNSDRIDNFRFYMLGGLRYDIDLASNSAARNAEDLIKLKKNDYGVEVGIGFNFYLPFVTVSPEIKFYNGMSNIHSRDAALKYSSVLDQLNSRMIMFSLHLED